MNDVQRYTTAIEELRVSTMWEGTMKCWWKNCRRKARSFVMIAGVRRKVCQAHLDQAIEGMASEYAHECAYCHTVQGV